jgi:hypothetical protein
MKDDDCDFLSVLDTKITQVSLQTTIYHSGCQVFCQGWREGEPELQPLASKDAKQA